MNTGTEIDEPSAVPVSLPPGAYDYDTVIGAVAAVIAGHDGDGDLKAKIARAVSDCAIPAAAPPTTEESGDVADPEPVASGAAVVRRRTRSGGVPDAGSADAEANGDVAVEEE